MPNILLDANMESVEKANTFLHETLANEKVNFSILELAIEEVLVNIVHYAYKNPESLKHQDMINKIEFGIRKIRFDNRPHYSMHFRDWGQPFNPFEMDDVDTLDMSIEDRPIGGLGVHLVKNVSSHQCYCDDDGVNTIEIFFPAEV